MPFTGRPDDHARYRSHQGLPAPLDRDLVRSAHAPATTLHLDRTSHGKCERGRRGRFGWRRRHWVNAMPCVEAPNEAPTGSSLFQRQDGSQGPGCSPVISLSSVRSAKPGETGWSHLDAHTRRTSLPLPWLPGNQGMPSRRGPFISPSANSTPDQVDEPSPGLGVGFDAAPRVGEAGKAPGVAQACRRHQPRRCRADTLQHRILLRQTDNAVTDARPCAFHNHPTRKVPGPSGRGFPQRG
jgi:hypothetical protein